MSNPTVVITETGIVLRTNKWSSLEFTAAADYDRGDMIKFSQVVGIVLDDVLNGAEGELIYRAEKIVVPKVAGTGITFAVGDKVYYVAASTAVTNSSSGNTLCGRALEAADASDTTVMIDLEGSVAA